MRKGQWLSRPMIVRQGWPTNEHDVRVAKARELRQAIEALSRRDDYCSKRDRAELVRALEEV